MKLPAHFIMMFALFTLSLGADDKVKRGGKLLFASGRTLEVVEIITLGCSSTSRGSSITPDSDISVINNGIEIDVNFATVEQITFVEPKLNCIASRGSTCISRVVDKGSVVNLELRSGKSATVELAGRLYPCTGDGVAAIRCTFLDALTDAAHTKYFPIGTEGESVVAVIFDDDHGTHRWSADSDQYFPPSYNFDPFTGSRLRWASPNVRPSTNGKKAEPTWACVSCRQVASEGPGACQQCKGTLFPAQTNIAEKGVAFFLEKAGYEVDSPEGRAAVRLSVQWLNPFATAEENQKALARAVKDVLGH